MSSLHKEVVNVPEAIVVSVRLYIPNFVVIDNNKWIKLSRIKNNNNEKVITEKACNFFLWKKRER